jgi:hypothetical protein
MQRRCSRRVCRARGFRHRPIVAGYAPVRATAHRTGDAEPFAVRGSRNQLAPAYTLSCHTKRGFGMRSRMRASLESRVAVASRWSYPPRSPTTASRRISTRANP